MNKLPSIYIAIPTSRSWKPTFGISLALTMSRLTQLQALGQIEKMFLNCNVNSLLPSGRQKILNDAMLKDYTHILWVDDDIKFPPTTVEMLLNHKLPVVAANISKKQIPSMGVANDVNEQPINKLSTGLTEVFNVGMGLMLVELEACKKVQAPHFEIIWLENITDYLGEDLYFQEKLKLAGYKIFIDNDLSKMCSHIGDYEYKLEVSV